MEARAGLTAGVDASSDLDRVRQAARKDKDARFTALLHHVSGRTFPTGEADSQRNAAARRVRFTGSPGIDVDTVRAGLSA
jgi:RNA-directed DNA polymerase